MKKYILLLYKIVVSLLLVTLIVVLSLAFSKKDELVIKNVTLKYFVNSMNNYDKENLKEFVANSENDVLYRNAIKSYELYHYDGVEEYEFTLDNYEVFGNGKYQCYFNYYKIPTCDLEHESKYVNLLVDTTTRYKTVIGEQKEIKEKGIVVFIKDGSNGNLFEWKLVRYDHYDINEGSN